MANNRNRNRAANNDNFFISGSSARNQHRNNKPVANPGASKSLLNRSRNFFGFGAAATEPNNSSNSLRNGNAQGNAGGNTGNRAPPAANQSGSVFNRIFSFTSGAAAPGAAAPAAAPATTGLVNAINQLKEEVVNNGNGSGSLPAANKRLPTATLVNGILKKMGNDSEKLREKITELNTQLRNQKAALATGVVNENALKNKEKTIRELKSVIKKLYALLYKIYTLHTVPNNARAKHLENIQQTLVRNKAVLNVVNRIISENNQILNAQRGAENLAIETAPLVVPGNAANRMGNRNRNRGNRGNSGNMNRGLGAAAAPGPRLTGRNQSSGINNMFRNIGEIPGNNRSGEAAEVNESNVEPEEAPEGQMNLVVPNRQIEQIMAQERANENMSLSNIVRKERNASEAAGEEAEGEEAGNTMTANRESPEETAEMPLNNNVMGRSKSVSRINRSKKIMAVLKKIEPISVNNALTKLRNY